MYSGRKILKNMMARLDELKSYEFYFQFTLTGYGRDIEPGIPDKKKYMIDIFRTLSERIGRERVIWRYDPILFNEQYTSEYHVKAFRMIAESLTGYTDRVVISFLDAYVKIKKNLERLKIRTPAEDEMVKLAGKLARIAGKAGMLIESCAERADLEREGIKHGSCIDRGLIEKLTGCRISSKKDRNQRAECGCIESVDVGTYDTCGNGCRYCYANFNRDRVEATVRAYDALSPDPVRKNRVGRYNKRKKYEIFKRASDQFA